MEHPKIFQKRLKEARVAKNWRQQDLAQMSGFHQSAINHFESGRRIPSFKNLILIANTLNISIDYLVGLDNQGLVSGNVWAKIDDWPKIRKLEKELRESEKSN